MIQKLIIAYLKIRYWKQRRKGYGLLAEHGKKETFVPGTHIDLTKDTRTYSQRMRDGRR